MTFPSYPAGDDTGAYVLLDTGSEADGDTGNTLDGVSVADALADPDAPLVIEIGGKKYTSESEWRRFLRWKELRAYEARICANRLKARHPEEVRAISLIQLCETRSANPPPLPGEAEVCAGLTKMFARAYQEAGCEPLASPVTAPDAA